MRTHEGKGAGWAHLRVVVACVGLLAAGIWVNLVGYGGVFLEPAITDASLEATRYAYHAGRMTVSLAFLAVPLLFERVERGLRLCVPLIMCFCTVVFALAFHQTLVPPLVLAGVASFVLGFAYLWVVATFYLDIARLFPLRQAIAVALVAQVLEQLASVAANYGLSASMQIIVCCLCPLVMLAALALLRNGPNAGDGREAPLAGAARTHTFVLLVASSVAIVALGAVSTVGVWGNVRVEYVTDATGAFVKAIASCSLLAVFALCSLLAAVERPLSYRYQVPFLIIVGGFMLAVLQPYASGWGSDAIADVLAGTEYFSHVLVWAIIMAAVKSRAGAPYLLAGAGLAPYAVISVGWIFLMETNQGASMLFALMVSYVLIIVVAVHPRLLYERKQHTFTSSEALNEYTIEGEPEIPLESNGAAVIDLMAKRCKLLGARFRLSRREVQVLVLLAQGRSRPAIQEMLVLSEGTVKTHIAHIYEKMAVKSHQELLDIVYATGEEASV